MNRTRNLNEYPPGEVIGFRMFKALPGFTPLVLLGFLLVGAICPQAVSAFPLRVDQDCFYGDGIPLDNSGVGTWMGYAIRFDPPYTPYTVDSVSVYITHMALARDAQRRLHVSVLDETGILRQYSETDWRELDNREGWLLIDLANREYDGPFTVVLHSGVGLAPSINMPPEAVFRLGISATDTESRSTLYTSEDPPPRPPSGMFAQQIMIEQAAETSEKLAPVSAAIPEFPGGNWMIRAHAPGLQIERTRIVITQADIDALYAPPEIEPPDWTMPRIEALGPRGMVHCPTNLGGVTLYYHEESRARKFSQPHDNPWAHSELIAVLGQLCRDLAAEGVVGIEHIGIYNPDTWIPGTNRPSSHQYGKGIDIAGFLYANGHVVLVEDNDDPNVRAILEHIRDEYLDKYFATVLDWTYQEHDNHFHVNVPY